MSYHPNSIVPVNSSHLIGRFIRNHERNGYWYYGSYETYCFQLKEEIEERGVTFLYLGEEKQLQHTRDEKSTSYVILQYLNKKGTIYKLK